MDNVNENKNEELSAEIADAGVKSAADSAEPSASSSLDNSRENPNPKKQFPLWALIAAAAAVVVALGVLIFFLFIKEEEPTYADYKITVVDELGHPVDQVMITFTDVNGLEKTRMTDQTGVATYKQALVCDYKLTLDAGLGSAIIKEKQYTLKKGTTEAEILVRNGESTVDIFGATLDDAYAYNIHVGEYDDVRITAGEYIYFVFQASTKGVYTFTVASEDSSAYLGYFGMPYLVYSEHIGGAHDGKTLDIIIQDTATPYVLGIKADNGGKCTLTAERTADAPFDPEYAPWTSVSASEKYLVDCDTTGKTLVDFNIASRTLSVTLGDDGYYYTNAGKRVYLRITSDAPYLEASLAFICGFVGDVGIEKIGGYIYDEDGNFVDKLNYNDMIEDYMDHCDETYGVVPLTDELAEAIKLHGKNKGWFDSNSGGYLFEGAAVNPDNLWLFLCMVEQ